MLQNRNFNPNKHSIFLPNNRGKYFGKDLPICRSSWEYKFCQWLDHNSNVIEWGSECIPVKYFDPVKKKMRTYFPDFYMKVGNKDGSVDNYMIEIKPYAQTMPPMARKGKARIRLIKEQATWLTNNAKWKYAEELCKKISFKFKIITEKNLF